MATPSVNCTGGGRGLHRAAIDLKRQVSARRDTLRRADQGLIEGRNHPTARRTRQLIKLAAVAEADQIAGLNVGVAEIGGGERHRAALDAGRRIQSVAEIRRRHFAHEQVHRGRRVRDRAGAVLQPLDIHARRPTADLRLRLALASTVLTTRAPSRARRASLADDNTGTSIEVISTIDHDHDEHFDQRESGAGGSGRGARGEGRGIRAKPTRETASAAPRTRLFDDRW